MKRKLLTLVAMHIAIMAMTNAYSHPEDVFFDDNRKIPTPKPKRKTKQGELSDKGLQEFVVNGETIIAHNEREAQKRYKARHK